ncbi:MAG: SDR family NAD-dependent epimerase/dehydratase [Candidatus Makaraimicrobium thalassicum]|nr:MAG: SDR family NAD-dependent epimerase/dehydratase [Candidatus Omnitrophota bacterium]
METATLITGGLGFIGLNLLKFIKADRIIVVDNFKCAGSIRHINKHILFLEGDVTDKKFVRMLSIYPINKIYHLASIASPKFYKKFPIDTIMTNVIGTLNICELALTCKARLLLSSTSEIYGQPEVHPQPESYFGHRNTVGDRSCYDCSKAVAETIVYEYTKKGLNAVIARIFNTYGPYMRPDDGRVISEFICRAIIGKPLIIHNGGNQTRSFCYVDDLCKGLILLMEKGKDLVYNVGNDQAEITINQLADLIEARLNKKLERKYIDVQDNDPVVRRPDLTKIRQLGYKPQVEIEQGLRKTIKYFRKQWTGKTFKEY